MSGNDPVDPALARLLDDPAVWVEVSADLRERTLAEATGDQADAPILRSPFDQPRHARRGAGPATPRWLRPVMLAAAAFAVLGVAVGGALILTSEDTPPDVQVALAGTQAAPTATATAELRDQPAGIEVELDVSELPPAPEGTFYEAWLVGEPGKVSAGTFHRRGDQDEIKMWLGVELDAYDAITVTRQPVAGGTTAEGVVLLRGELP